MIPTDPLINFKVFSVFFKMDFFSKAFAPPGGKGIPADVLCDVFVFMKKGVGSPPGGKGIPANVATMLAAKGVPVGMPGGIPGNSLYWLAAKGQGGQDRPIPVHAQGGIHGIDLLQKLQNPQNL